MPRFKLCPQGHKYQGKRCDQCAKSYEKTRRNQDAKRYYNSKEWRTLRQACGERDHFICQSCNEPASESFHADHIVERESGGVDALDNLQTLCRACHSRKTIRSINQR